MSDNLVAIVKDYFERALLEVPGMKCLIMDQETTTTVSLISSQSEILKKDVYLIEFIHKDIKESLQHMKALYIIRPTESNFKILQKELKNPRFSEYHLYFSNTIQDSEIKKLAECDIQDKVRHIEELYLDYQAINSELFSLDIPFSMNLSLQPHDELGLSTQKQIFERMTDGLFAIVMSLKKIPYIRYQGKSSVCLKLAKLLNFQKDCDLNSNQFSKDSKAVLLIIERKEDPITPLLTQWTYQAQLHELIGIEKNVVSLAKINKQYQNSKLEDRSLVIGQSDPFFVTNAYSNFGELASNVKIAIDHLSSHRQNSIKIENLEDMQRALDSLPELKQYSSNVQKHVTLTCEISRIVEERVSRVEQDIACKDNRSEHLRSIQELLNNLKVSIYDKIRLVLLYALRYEKDSKIQFLKEQLVKLGAQQNSIGLLDCVLAYAGKSQREGDLFQNKDFFSQAKNIMKSTFKDVPNVYTQHEPYIINLLDNLEKFRLKESEFPYLNSAVRIERPSDIILFQIGGTTYTEAREVALKNKNFDQNHIYLGGTTIHNSKTFFAEVSKIDLTENNQSMTLDNRQGSFYQLI